ncbi:DUF1540 domain-containing protein [Petralouisia muris]|uniref:DUF1540 domain-containing protein n=1 Tax=Petralouisia muris TaxID=3032872 RepID=A0AC61RXB3_9FIRM|nr:DUF1540 domain-containing protein [Petralouisia muris]TGY96528.1 DUF1540 domain-containing protein [Petralouisia muris]
MTQLKCSARNCMYNDEQLCSKGDITIGGHDASKSNETCCESFRERTGSMTNSVGHASKEVSVKCQATNCDFNDNCRCSANEIGIAGSNACSCGETECASFDCHCK